MFLFAFSIVLALGFFLYRVFDKKIDRNDITVEKEKHSVFKTFPLPPTPVKLSEVDVNQIRLHHSIVKEDRSSSSARFYTINKVTYEYRPFIVTFEPISVKFYDPRSSRSIARVYLSPEQKDKILEIFKKIRCLARDRGIDTGGRNTSIDRQIQDFKDDKIFSRIRPIYLQKMVDVKDVIRGEVELRFSHIFLTDHFSYIMKTLDPSPGIYKGVKERIIAQITEEFQSTPPFNVLDDIQFF